MVEASGRQLALNGARVYATGRSAPDHHHLGEQTMGIRRDHRVDAEVESAFNLIVGEAGAIDILVNKAWGGYERMVENGTFTWPKPFWERPLWRWDAIFNAGVRAHYQASQLAAPTMIAQRRGLIVNISFWAAQKHIGNVAYGVSKAATDKMTADMATELKPWRRRCFALSGTRANGKGYGSSPVPRFEQFRVARVHRTGRCGPRVRS